MSSPEHPRDTTGKGMHPRCTKASPKSLSGVSSASVNSPRHVCAGYIRSVFSQELRGGCAPRVIEVCVWRRLRVPIVPLMCPRSVSLRRCSRRRPRRTQDVLQVAPSCLGCVAWGPITGAGALAIQDELFGVSRVSGWCPRSVTCGTPLGSSLPDRGHRYEDSRHPPATSLRCLLDVLQPTHARHDPVRQRQRQRRRMLLGPPRAP